nr:V-type proton ATPase catalytic subunit A [Ipomoea batatas]
MSGGWGDLLTGGDLYANVIENSLVQHHVTLPPDGMGKITYIAPLHQANTLRRTLFLNLSFKVSKSSIPCFRPVAEKLAADTPLLTGQRVLDALLPSVLGGYLCNSWCIWLWENSGRPSPSTPTQILVVGKEEMKWQSAQQLQDLGESLSYSLFEDDYNEARILKEESDKLSTLPPLPIPPFPFPLPPLPNIPGLPPLPSLPLPPLPNILGLPPLPSLPLPPLGPGFPNTYSKDSSPYPFIDSIPINTYSKASSVPISLH